MRVTGFGCLFIVLLSCGTKVESEPVPRLGWFKAEGWAGSCYFPVDFAAMGPGDRRIARQEVLEQMMSQWQGTRQDGVAFSAETVETVETVLLGLPEAIESTSGRNAALCEAFMTSHDKTAWAEWLTELPGRLSEGQCSRSFIDVWFNYLDIAREWQFPAPVCEGDAIMIRGSSIDYYRVADKGPWITNEGDLKQPASGRTDLPCNIEGCYLGQLILRFRGRSGIAQIFPVGRETVFTAPEHGQIDVMINDNTWYDNKYKVESGLEHHALVEYSPKR